MRTSATDEIVLLGSYEGARKAERGAHHQFADIRRFGEWFTDCPKLRKFISEKLGGQPLASSSVESGAILEKTGS